MDIGELVIPTELLINVPGQKNVGKLGTDVHFVSELDSKYLAREDEFKRKAIELRREREENGEESIYYRLQPFYHPELDDLVGRRIVFYSCFGRAGMRWCKGEVLGVCLNRRDPAVNVLWDAMPDVTKYKDETEEEVNLLPSKWNKDCDGAWMMNVNVSIGDFEDALGNKMDEKDGDIDTDAYGDIDEYDSDDPISYLQRLKEGCSSKEKRLCELEQDSDSYDSDDSKDLPLGKLKKNC